MKFTSLFILISFCFSSCFLFSHFHKNSFHYRQDGTRRVIPEIIPKGYISVELNKDSSGNVVQIYHYKEGAILYASYLADTMIQIQPINKADNIPREHPYGGLVYKGQDSAKLFWREIRRKNFRFGYRFVSSSQETLFDSSTNFMSLQRLY